MDAKVKQARQVLMAQILQARSLSEVAEANRTLIEWMRAHPEDQGMRDGFEHLSLRQEIAEGKEATPRVQEPQPAGHTA